MASSAHAAGPELVERAVEAARAAAPGWAATPYGERCRLLRAVADGIGERHMELAALASLETGKSRTESILEVQEAIDLIEAYAGHMEENEGYTQPLNSFVEGERNVDVLRPYGVFGVIAPFNFPVALSMGMSSSALIAGNTVVFKPSEESPASGRRARRDRGGGRAARRASSTSCTAGPDTGRALVDAGRGRHRVHGLGRGRARDRAQAAGRAATRGRRSPRWAARTRRSSPTAPTSTRRPRAWRAPRSGSPGQKCSACSRAIVVDSVHDEFVEQARRAARRSCALGDPSDRDAFVGPVINEGSVERFERAVAAAERDGRVAAGGGAPDLPGHFVEPTVVAGPPAWATRSSATSCSCRS